MSGNGFGPPAPYTEFDNQLFIRQMYQDSDDPKDLRPMRKELLKLWYQIVDQVGPKNFSGRLLDIGSGPAIFSVISASRGDVDITVSDFTDEGIAELDRFIKKDPKAYDWIHWFEYAATMEASGVTAKDIEARLQKTVKRAVFSDVHLENITAPYVAEPYDVITSQLTLDAASKSVEDFRRAAKNVKGMMKDGGHLFLAGVINTTMYNVGDKTFHVLPLTPEFLKKEFSDLGFTDITINVQKVTDPKYMKLVNCTDMFGFHAIKGKN